MTSTNPGSGVHILQVCPKGLGIGEGPHWIGQKESLIFVDIQEGKLYRLYTSTGRLQTLTIGEGVLGVGVCVCVCV